MENKDKVYWYDDTKPDKKGRELSESERYSWRWFIELFRKKPEQLTDQEKEIQKIYTNTFIF